MEARPRPSLPCRLRGILARSLATLAVAAAAGCYTEIGNPAKENQVTATFSIDYDAAPAPKSSAAPKGAVGIAASAGAGAAAGTGSLAIDQFRFNVVEANYSTPEESDNRLWKVPDSMGLPVDFTGRDTSAVLKPISVPPGEWIFMKLESRIPDHDTLGVDTLDFAAFDDPGYIKGAYTVGGRTRRFLCQLPPVYRVNLVYEQALLETLRHGDAYDLEFIFYARRWLGDVDLLAADTVLDRSGAAVSIVDLEHNRGKYDTLTKNFYRAFNSSKAWKEIREE